MNWIYWFLQHVNPHLPIVWAWHATEPKQYVFSHEHCIILSIGPRPLFGPDFDLSRCPERMHPKDQSFSELMNMGNTLANILPRTIPHHPEDHLDTIILTDPPAPRIRRRKTKTNADVDSTLPQTGRTVESDGIRSLVRDVPAMRKRQRDVLDALDFRGLARQTPADSVNHHEIFSFRDLIGGIDSSYPIIKSSPTRITGIS